MNGLKYIDNATEDSTAAQMLLGTSGILNAVGSDVSNGTLHVEYLLSEQGFYM